MYKSCYGNTGSTATCAMVEQSKHKIKLCAILGRVWGAIGHDTRAQAKVRARKGTTHLIAARVKHTTRARHKNTSANGDGRIPWYGSSEAC